MRWRRDRLSALGASTKQASLFRPASLLLLFVLAQIRLIGEQDAVLQQARQPIWLAAAA